MTGPRPHSTEVTGLRVPGNPQSPTSWGRAGPQSRQPSGCPPAPATSLQEHTVRPVPPLPSSQAALAGAPRARASNSVCFLRHTYCAAPSLWGQPRNPTTDGELTRQQACLATLGGPSAQARAQPLCPPTVEHHRKKLRWPRTRASPALRVWWTPSWVPPQTLADLKSAISLHFRDGKKP